MDAPLLTPHDLIRPWRRATVVASAIAAIELALLLGAGALLLAKPVSHLVEQKAASNAAAPSKKLEAAIRAMNAPAGKTKPRHEMKVLVLNGNGENGAAGGTAQTLQSLGYRISATGNAKHQNYATTVVMYKPGFRAEGIRLAQDLGAKVVGPLDGLAAGALHGGQLAVIVGA